jgi:outer membrane murein-binding lipoprotein Lpp
MSDEDPDRDGLDIPLGDYCHMGPRIDSLERSQEMIANNLAGHELKELAQYAELASQVRELSSQVRELHRKMDRLVVKQVRKLFDTETDFDQMTDNVAAIGKVVKMLKWLFKMVVGVATGLLTLWGVFHFTESKGEPAPDPVQQETRVGE